MLSTRKTLGPVGRGSSITITYRTLPWCVRSQYVPYAWLPMLRQLLSIFHEIASQMHIRQLTAFLQFRLQYEVLSVAGARNSEYLVAIRTLMYPAWWCHCQFGLRICAFVKWRVANPMDEYIGVGRIFFRLKYEFGGWPFTLELGSAESRQLWWCSWGGIWIFLLLRVGFGLVSYIGMHRCTFFHVVLMSTYPKDATLNGHKILATTVFKTPYSSVAWSPEAVKSQTSRATKVTIRLISNSTTRGEKSTFFISHSSQIFQPLYSGLFKALKIVH